MIQCEIQKERLRKQAGQVGARIHFNHENSVYRNDKSTERINHTAAAAASGVAYQTLCMLLIIHETPIKLAAEVAKKNYMATYNAVKHLPDVEP